MNFLLEGIALALAVSGSAVGAFLAVRRRRRKPDPATQILNEAIDALQAVDNDFRAVRTSDGRARYSPSLGLLIAVFDGGGVREPEAYIATVLDPHPIENNWSIDCYAFRNTDRYETLASCKRGTAPYQRLVEVFSLQAVTDIINRRYHAATADIIPIHKNKRTP